VLVVAQPGSERRESEANGEGRHDQSDAINDPCRKTATGPGFAFAVPAP
jgi:hypothetical protein